MTIRTVTGSVLNLHGAARTGDLVSFRLVNGMFTATEHVPQDTTDTTIDGSGNISVSLYCPATYDCWISGAMNFTFTLPDDPTTPTTLEALHAVAEAPPTASDALQSLLDTAALRGNNLSDLTSASTARTNLAVYSTTQGDARYLHPASGASGQELVYGQSVSPAWRNVPTRNILDVIDPVASDHTATVKAAFVAYPHWHVPPNTTVKLTEQLRTGTPDCVVIPSNGSLVGQDRDTSKILLTTDTASDNAKAVFLLESGAGNPARQYIADLNIVGAAATPMVWTNGSTSIFYENDGQAQSTFRVAPVVFERVRFSAYRGFPIHSETARLMAQFCSFIDCGNGFNVNGAGSSCERSYFERAEGCEMSGINASVLFNVFNNALNVGASIGGFNTANHPEYHGGTVMGNYINGVSGIGIIVAETMSDTRIIGNYLQQTDSSGIQVSASTTYLTNGVIISDNHLVSCTKPAGGSRIAMYILGDNCRIHRNRVYNRSDITTHATLECLLVQTASNTSIGGNEFNASGGGNWAVDLSGATNVTYEPGNVLTAGASGALQMQSGATFRHARYVNSQIVASSSDRTALVIDRAIYTTTSTANRTITLPSAVGIPGLRYRIQKVDSAVGTVTIDPSGTETIDGVLTKTLSQKFSGCEIESDGANWHSLDLAAAPTERFDWTVDGDRYYVAPDAMTLALAQTAGTGTPAYTKALAASPTTFNSTTLPVTLAAGDILKLSTTGVSGYFALALRRVA